MTRFTATDLAANAGIVDLATAPEAIQEQAAALLVHGFDEPSGWATLAAARDEVAQVLRDGFAQALVLGDNLLGWIGGLPQS